MRLTDEELDAFEEQIKRKEIWLVQAFEEGGEDYPLFCYAFTSESEAVKVRDAGVEVNSGAGMWTVDRVVLDAAEDAMRVIEEMAAIKTSENLEEVKLWYVVGIGGAYYGTKMQAEEETRSAFPNEDAGKRYSRIYYKTFYQEV
tara:strand:- start:4400 stop:4831 length:432 start_codon:yes stop_codon:yes gene_type:complete